MSNTMSAQELELSRDFRDEIIGDCYTEREYRGGIRHFESLTVEQLAELIEEGFANVKDRQNDSPTIGEFLDFAKRNGGAFVFDGYTRDRHLYKDGLNIDVIRATERPDEETIEGLKRQLAFERFARNADELHIHNGRMRAWWD